MLSNLPPELKNITNEQANNNYYTIADKYLLLEEQVSF